MGLEETIEQANRAAPKHLKGHPFIKTAIVDVAAKRERLGPDLVGEILARAEDLAKEWIPPDAHGEDPELFAPTGGDFITSEIVLK